MSSEHRAADCLAAILGNIGDIEDYTAGLESDAFERDELTRDAVERCVERVCAALSRLGECAPALMPELPWSGIGSVGDRLRRDCDRIGAGILWGILDQDLQRLKLTAALALARLQSEANDG